MEKILRKLKKNGQILILLKFRRKLQFLRKSRVNFGTLLDS